MKHLLNLVISSILILAGLMLLLWGAHQWYEIGFRTSPVFFPGSAGDAYLLFIIFGGAFFVQGVLKLIDIHENYKISKGSK